MTSPETMTNEELAQALIDAVATDTNPERYADEAARRLRAAPETLIVVIEKKADRLYLATTPQWKAIASDPTFDGAVSKLIGCVHHLKEWAVAHGRLEDAKKSTPANIGQGAGTEWAVEAAKEICEDYFHKFNEDLGIVSKVILRHFPHPLAGGELREVACFCEGVFSIIEAAPTSFSMGGVKEARRRIAAALTKGPVSP